MLSIAKLAAGGQRYYLDQAKARVEHRESVASGVEDYYLGAPEARGTWTGAEAARLGLAGRTVDDETLHRALSWTDPLTGDELAGPVSRARVPGFDLMFSVPKSASVMFGIGDIDVRETVRRAQQEAVGEALAYLESVACRGRLGAGGQGGSFDGRGFLAAAFEHGTSRAGDPQLHTHVLIANTVQRPDGQWATFDGRLLYAHAKTAGYVHEAAFRRAMARDLGLKWGPVVNGIADIGGVPAEVLNAFSRRSQEIDAYVRERGETSAAARQTAAVRTREAKNYRVTPAILMVEWQVRAAELGFGARALDDLLERTTSRAGEVPQDHELAQRLCGRDGLNRSASHFDRRDVVQAIASLCRQGASRAEIEHAADAFLASREVVPLLPRGARRSDVLRRDDGRVVYALPEEQRYATPALLARERQVLGAVRERGSDRVGVADDEHIAAALAARPTIGDDQARTVRRLTTGGEGVQVVVGPAGSGKTFALDAARAAWEASGMVVRGAAVARAAAHVLSDEAGIESTSVAALLAELRRRACGLEPESVLVLDEAGMLGTFDLAEILDHAADARAKVVLVGDPGQLPKFDAGGCFRALAAQPGAVALEQNRRQRHEHDREKVDLLRAGRPEAALAVAAKHGDVIVADSREDVIARMVHDYCQALGSEPNSVMIAARRSEVAELNAQARAIRDRDGHLGAWRVDIAGTEFAVGDRVIIKRNERRLGIQNGNRGSVTAVDAERTAITVELADRRRVVLDAALLERPGRHRQPSLVHGYAATAHVMQGQTTERAFVLGSEGIYREWGYVAMTRARERTMFYVCDGEASAELERSRAQLTAHDLAERQAVAHLSSLELAAEQRALAQRLVDDPRAEERHTIERLEEALGQARASLNAAARRRARPRELRGGILTRRRLAREVDARAAEDVHRTRKRIDDLSGQLDDIRSVAAGSRWAESHRDDLVRQRAVADEIEARARTRTRAFRHVEPPAYVVDTLGARPDGPSARHVWDHGLRVIERYRARHGVNDRFRPLGSHPINRDASQWLIANRELQRTARTLGRDAEPERDRTVTDRLL